MKRLAAGLLSVGLLTAAALVGAGPAAAHAVLVATDPAANSAVSSGPARVSATFNEKLQTRFASMTVVGPDRNLWNTGDTAVDGAVASVAVLPLGPVGTYTVNYRVTSADGHPVEGSWKFELTVAGTGVPGPPVTGGAGSAPDTSVTSRPPAEPVGDGHVPIWPFAIGAIVAVAAGLWWARPKS